MLLCSFHLHYITWSKYWTLMSGILVFLYAFFIQWRLLPTNLSFYTISYTHPFPPSYKRFSIYPSSLTHIFANSVLLFRTPMETTDPTIFHKGIFLIIAIPCFAHAGKQSFSPNRQKERERERRAEGATIFYNILQPSKVTNEWRNIPLSHSNYN